MHYWFSIKTIIIIIIIIIIITTSINDTLVRCQNNVDK